MQMFSISPQEHFPLQFVVNSWCSTDLPVFEGSVPAMAGEKRERTHQTHKPNHLHR